MLYKSAIMAFIGMDDWYGWNKKVIFCIFEWADAPSFTYGFQRREFVCVLIAAGLNLPHFACNHSHSHFYHEDFICQFSLLQPAQPPTPPSSCTIQHPGELLQVVRQSTTRRLMNCMKCIGEMWNMDGVGEGEEVKLTLRDRGLAVAEQGRTSPGYMFMHWGWRSEELRERRQECGLCTANENKWSSHSPSIPHNGMFPS